LFSLSCSLVASLCNHFDSFVRSLSTSPVARTGYLCDQPLHGWALGSSFVESTPLIQTSAELNLTVMVWRLPNFGGGYQAWVLGKLPFNPGFASRRSAFLSSSSLPSAAPFVLNVLRFGVFFPRFSTHQHDGLAVFLTDESRRSLCLAVSVRALLASTISRSIPFRGALS
jgi:hypothetical protein